MGPCCQLDRRWVLAVSSSKKEGEGPRAGLAAGRKRAGPRGRKLGRAQGERGGKGTGLRPLESPSLVLDN